MALSTPASDTSLPLPGGPAGEMALARAKPRGSSLYRDAWRRLVRNKLAVVGGITIIFLCLVAIFADVLSPYPYAKANFGKIYEFPSAEYPLGTDQLGRDVLSRMIYGAFLAIMNLAVDLLYGVIDPRIRY